MHKIYLYLSYVNDATAKICISQRQNFIGFVICIMFEEPRKWVMKSALKKDK